MISDSQSIKLIPGVSAALRDACGPFAYMTSSDGDVLFDVDYIKDYYAEEDLPADLWPLIEDCDDNYLLLFK